MRLIEEIAMSKNQNQNQVTKTVETQTERETESEPDNEDDSNTDIEFIEKAPSHPRLQLRQKAAKFKYP